VDPVSDLLETLQRKKTMPASSSFILNPEEEVVNRSQIQPIER
jgi:hypothetical protein